MTSGRGPPSSLLSAIRFLRPTPVSTDLSNQIKTKKKKTIHVRTNSSRVDHIWVLLSEANLDSRLHLYGQLLAVQHHSSPTKNPKNNQLSDSGREKSNTLERATFPVFTLYILAILSSTASRFSTQSRPYRRLEFPSSVQS